MMWFSEICALIVGVGTSSLVWVNLMWKREDFHKAIEQNLVDGKNAQLKEFEEEKSVWIGELAKYTQERGLYPDLLISLSHNSEELQKQLAEVEYCKRGFERRESEFQEREIAYKHKICDLKGQLKGARAKKRRKSKIKDNSTPPSV